MAVHRGGVINHGDIVSAAAGNVELRSPRGNVGMARQNPLAVHRLLHRDLAQAIEACSKAGREAGRHVLRDDDGRRIRRHAHEHLANGLGPARGCANRNDLLRRQTAQQARRGRRRDGCSSWRAGHTDARTGGRCRHPVHTCHGSDPDFVDDLRCQFVEPTGQPDTWLGHKIHRPQLQRPHGDLCAALGQC